jgi:hypothetical protein
MKAKIAAFIDQLLIYDYLLFGTVIALFILLLLLAILLRKKTALAISLVFIAFLTLILGPTVGYLQLHKFLFSTNSRITEVKELEFSQAIVIKGELSNTSKHQFSTCKIRADLYKVSGNTYLDLLYPLNPFKKMSILQDVNLSPGQSSDFKMIVEPFTYSKEYNVSIQTECR